MGKRGPLPKPTAQREYEGNPANRPLPKNEPRPAVPDAVPEPPDWLDRLAALCWETLAPELHRVGLLTAVDLPAFEAFCVSYSYWREMLKRIEQEGHVAVMRDDHGNVKWMNPTPEATLARQYAGEMKKWGAVLGIGPAHRASLSGIDKPTSGTKQASKPANPMQASLGGAR